MLQTKIISVPIGTVIEKNGEKHTVTDESFVVSGSDIYVTEKTYKAIEEKVPSSGLHSGRRPQLW